MPETEETYYMNFIHKCKLDCMKQSTGPVPPKHFNYKGNVEACLKLNQFDCDILDQECQN